MKLKNIFIVTVLLILGITNLGYTFSGQEFDLLVQNFGKPGPQGISILNLPEEEISNLAGEDYHIVGFANFENNILKKSNENIIYQVQPGDSLYLIAINYDITVNELKQTNNLDTDVIFVGQNLIIPQPSFDPNPEPDNNDLIYSVQPGDTLYLIAKQYGITVQQIKQENDLKTDVINIGQKLYIPLPDEEANSEKNARVMYYVQSGDSLYSIAEKFDVTVNQINELNDLQSNVLYPGQLIYVPAESSYEDQVVYFVKSGDSLYLLASKFNTSVSQIKLLNSLNSDVLYIGQKLYLPVPDTSTKEYNIVLSYSVKEGDSLISIANKHDVSAWEIRSYNNLESDVLYEGQVINIPFAVSSDCLTNSYSGISKGEMELMARAVYSEARGEPFIGQVAVAAVILNRVRHPFFPNNINDVIFQPWQFSAVHDGQFWLTPDQDSYIAVQAALQGWDPTKGAIYYYNPETAESKWVYYRNVVIKIGNHYFAV